MASQGNRHYANCIGTLSFPMLHLKQAQCWFPGLASGHYQC